MKLEFGRIKEGSSLMLQISKESNEMEMAATLERFVKEDVAIISLEDETDKILNFDNVRVNMVYISEKGLPYIWRNVRIVFFKGQYVLQVNEEGMRHNRRAFFRVGISRQATMRTATQRALPVMIRDISLCGFGITERRGSFTLVKGEKVAISMLDSGFEIKVEGNVVRVDEHDGYVIYGFALTRDCKDLPSYIAFKQRRKRTEARMLV